MGLAISSVNGGVATLSNGQRIQLGSAGPATGPAGPTPMNPYAPYPTQLAPTQAMGLGANTAQNPSAGPKGLIAGPDTPTGGATAGGLVAASSGEGAVPNRPGGYVYNQGDTTPATTVAKPAPIDYYAQYDSALGASRANLENQYIQAQGSIDQQQKDANATLATVPGTFNTIASQQAGAAKAETGNLIGMDAAAGMGGNKGGGDALARSQAEMSSAATQNAAANTALVPSLALGVKTQMDAERAQLADAKSTAEGQIDQSAMSAAAQRGAAEQSNANDVANEKTQHAQAVGDATTAFNRQVVLSGLNSASDLSNLSTKVPGMTVGDEKAITASPYFSMFTNEINSGKDPNGKSVTSATLATTLANMAASANANIPGYSGNAGAGLLSVLKSYYGPTLGLTK